MLHAGGGVRRLLLRVAQAQLANSVTLAKSEHLLLWYGGEWAGLFSLIVARLIMDTASHSYGDFNAFQLLQNKQYGVH